MGLSDSSRRRAGLHPSGLLQPRRQIMRCPSLGAGPQAAPAAWRGNRRHFWWRRTRRYDAVAVLSNDGHEIERTVCASIDAAIAAAIHMLCPRGDDLKAGDVLRVLASA
jgi:hypothetical protein